MKIAYIAAGAGGMYCGSCIHDNTLAAALQQKGHEVALLPTYTPLRTDEESVSDPHLFYGAVNVYLQHKSRFFRRTPRLFDRLLDRPAVLRWIARLGASTDPRKLGQLTLDVLRGESGPQSKELERLVAWLADSYRPDIVQITNSLLLGMVRRLRAELGVPVVVALQGEDLFVDQLLEPHRGRVLAELRERANDPDLFIAPSRYYADHMANILGQERSRIDLVPLGIQLDGHGASPTDSRKRDGVTIGYLARICPEKGLHRLVDAFIALAGESGASALRLRVAGYLGARDRGYWAEQQRRIADAGLADRVDFLGEIDRVDKIRFLNTLDLLSVPTVYREPKGLFALEAMANAVPVVLPNHGSFPELLADTGGGLLFEADSVSDLVAALRRLIERPQERRALGEAGRDAVHRRRDSATMAEASLAIFRRLLESPMEGNS